MRSSQRAKKLSPFKEGLIKYNYQNLEWLDFLIKKTDEYKFDIDLQFIKNFPQIKDKVNNWKFAQIDSKFSCAINCVENTILPSIQTNATEANKIPKVEYDLLRNNYSNLGKKIKELYTKI